MPSNPYKIVQFEKAIEAAEESLVEAAMENENLPLTALEAVVALIEEKAEVVDDFVRWCHGMDAKINLLKDEEKLMRQMRNSAERALSATKDYIRAHLDLGIDSPEAESQKLEGRFLKVWTQKNGIPSLKIEDQDEVPEEYRSLTVEVKLPAAAAHLAEVVEQFIAAEEIEGAVVKTGTPNVDETRIREALKAGAAVQGAKLETTRSLRVTPLKTVKKLEAKAAKEEQKQLAGGAL